MSYRKGPRVDAYIDGLPECGPGPRPSQTSTVSS
jgi:hypothetical protein